MVLLEWSQPSTLDFDSAAEADSEVDFGSLVDSWADLYSDFVLEFGADPDSVVAAGSVSESGPGTGSGSVIKEHCWPTISQLTEGNFQ